MSLYFFLFIFFYLSLSIFYSLSYHYLFFYVSNFAISPSLSCSSFLSPLLSVSLLSLFLCFFFINNNGHFFVSVFLSVYLFVWISIYFLFIWLSSRRFICFFLFANNTAPMDRFYLFILCKTVIHHTRNRNETSKGCVKKPLRFCIFLITF